MRVMTEQKARGKSAAEAKCGQDSYHRNAGVTHASQQDMRWGTEVSENTRGTEAE